MWRNRCVAVMLIVVTIVVLGETLQARNGVSQEHRVIVEPGGKVLVTQEDGVVTFEVWGQTGPGSQEYRPSVIAMLSVYPAGSERRLWAIILQHGDPVARITYGMVPEEFKQTQPVNGPAPALRDGEKYRVYAGIGFTVGVTEFRYKRTGAGED